MTNSPIRKSIQKTISQIAALEKVEQHFLSVLEKEELQAKKVDLLEQKEMKELEDVDNLESLSMKSLFHKVLGSKEEQIEKERQEYLQVSLKKKEAVQALEVITFEREVLEKKLVTLDDLRKELTVLKDAREKEILQSPGHLRNELVLNDNKQDKLTYQIGHIQSVMTVGNQVLQSLLVVRGHLKKASDWGQWDMMGRNGRYSDHMKHREIDMATREISRSQIFLENYKQALHNIGYSTNKMILKIEGMGRFVDVFFDNIITDWIIQNKIKAGLNSVESIIDEVKLAQQTLEHEIKKAQQAQVELEAARDQILLG